MIHADDIRLLAGPRALKRIRDGGLSEQDIQGVAGAAGGPKWLILGEFDRWLFGEVFRQPGSTVELAGASIGAWRFAAACHPDDPVSAINRLEEAYIVQQYSDAPDRQEITATTRGILHSFMDARLIDGLLDHPRLKLNVITARARGWAGQEHPRKLALGASGAVLGNIARRAWLGLGFDRVLFQSPGARAKFADDGIPTLRTPLTRDNALEATYSSGCIPMLMTGVVNPAEAPAGVYRDGGIVDYHIDHPLVDEGIVLMPHFSDRLTPGWFDKFVKWRRPRYAENLLMVAPGPGLLERLPGGKVPDRKDFETLAGNDRLRIRNWRTSVDEGRRMTESFRELLESGQLGRRVEALWTAPA